MDEFLRSYGLWVLLGGVFLAMHWFGMRFGSTPHGHERGKEAEPGNEAGPPARSRRAGGCH